jgi:type IV fimbrial biogenesis protein FimT
VLIAASRRKRGFTLIELLVAISVVAILVSLAIPSFRAWVANSQTRAVGETLANALRLAQSTAVNQSSQVTFCLTNNSLSNKASLTTGDCATDGKNWFVLKAGHAYDAANTYVQGGTLATVSSNVAITVPANKMTTFNSLGRAITTSSLTAPDAYVLTNPNGDRTYDVTVSFGGQVRMCDATSGRAAAADTC